MHTAKKRTANIESEANQYAKENAATNAAVQHGLSGVKAKTCTQHSAACIQNRGAAIPLAAQSNPITMKKGR